MQPEEMNKVLIQRIFEEGVNAGRLEIVDESFSEQFLDFSTPEQERGPSGVKEYFRMVRTGFPDMRVSIDDLIAEYEKVVVRTTWRGTHLGTYYGVPPTGQRVTRTLIQIFMVMDSKIVG